MPKTQRFSGILLRWLPVIAWIFIWTAISSVWVMYPHYNYENERYCMTIAAAGLFAANMAAMLARYGHRGFAIMVVVWVCVVSGFSYWSHAATGSSFLAMASVLAGLSIIAFALNPRTTPTYRRLMASE